MARKPDPYIRKVVALPAETWAEIADTDTRSGSERKPRRSADCF